MPNKTTKDPTITDKLANLDSQVEWFYGEDFDLSVALERYQAAVDLAREIETDLSELRNKVELLQDFTKS